MNIRTSAHCRFEGSPQEVWDIITDMERFPHFFDGYGLIPAVVRIELQYENPAIGERRLVHSSDGGIVTEEILAFVPQVEHRYRLIDGFAPPFSWMVSSAEGTWRIEDREDGVHVTWDYLFVVRSLLLVWLTAPVVWVFFRGAMQRCLDKMAKECSSSVAPQ